MSAPDVLPPAESFSRRMGVAVFVFSLGLLLYELCLTRVLSVFFYYHTAFLAVSLAMLGIGAGGVWVYILGARVGTFNLGRWMLTGGLSVAGLPILFALLPLDYASMNELWQGRFVYVFLPVALACLIPFLVGGVVWAAWFRAYRDDAAMLYGWDLVGAATGALLLVPVMNLLGGPAALLVAGLLLLSSTTVATSDGKQRWPRRLAVIAAAGVAVLLGLQQGYDLLAIQVEKTDSDTKVLYKRWNAFSRVALLDERRSHRGLSEARRHHWRGKLPEERAALIDINAFAPLIRYDGDREKVRYLEEMVSNVGYHLLPRGQEVAILGPGGGKDVLAALLFAPKRVVGIEINPILVHEVVRGHSRQFTGDIYRHPKVTIHVGDARAELERMREARFGLIVANSVATFAAHSSGALNLTEQSLYTVQACRLYLERLAPQGLLSVSLWDDRAHPLALRWLRTCGVAARELERDKKGDPKAASGKASILAERAAVVSARWEDDTYFTTILIGRSALSAAQRRRILALSKRWGYEPVYVPGHGGNRRSFGSYVATPASFVASYVSNIAASTDDKPFFHYTSRVSGALELLDEDAREDNVAVVNLLLSLLLVCALLVLIVGFPLGLFALRRRASCPLGPREIAYFLLIGLGFMFVEIPLIQRLTLFLGHPTYALTVVLAGLLLYSGLGALLAGRWGKEKALGRWRWALLLLCALLVALGLGLDTLIAAFGDVSTAARIIVVLVFLAPLGLVMGLPLPLAMLDLGDRDPKGIPWAWAINGAASVVASVAALMLAALWGFRAVFFLALGCYVLAALAARVRGASSEG